MYNNIMKSHSPALQKNLPGFVLNLIDAFQKAGFEIYAVGGAVRDLLMNKNVNDWDFTTNATPEEMLKLYPEAFYNNLFGTVGMKVDEIEKPLEVTTFRSEKGYSDRRRPDKIVWGKSLEEDLARRDFTINAMALRLKDVEKRIKCKEQINEKSMPYALCSMSLIDPYNGQDDLQKEIIRAVGNPVERFSEDALRTMRAVRIATELGFVIEEKTFEAIRTNASLIHHISAERIRDELLKILASSFPYEGFAMLRNCSLLKEILPEVEQAFDVPQKSPKRHHVVDVGTHMFYSLRYCPSRDSIVRLAALLHDVGKPATFKKDEETGIITFYNHDIVGAGITKQIVKRLKFPKKDADKIIKLVRWHLFSVDERQTDSAIKRFIRNVGQENLEDMLAVRVGDRLGGGAKETSWRLELFKKRLVEVQKQPFSVKDLKVNGNDIMKELNIPSGPKVGEVLNTLFAEVEEGKLKNGREELIKRIQELDN